MFKKGSLQKYLVLMMVMFVFSCGYNASFVKVSHDALQVSSVAYDTTMLSAGSLYKRDIIDENKKDDIIEAALKYSKAHNLAVEYLARYEESKESAPDQELEDQLALATEALTDLLFLIAPYLGE